MFKKPCPKNGVPLTLSPLLLPLSPVNCTPPHLHRGTADIGYRRIGFTGGIDGVLDTHFTHRIHKMVKKRGWVELTSR